MKTVISILGWIVILLFTIEAHAQENNSIKQSSDSLYSTRSRSIVLHERKGTQITTDGKFNKGEWDEALYISNKDNYGIYLKADAEFLYIGLKSAQQIGELVCEIRITSNNKEVFLLHVSGALGEGISGFPVSTKFDLNKNRYWEANFLQPDSIKKEAWIAAGKPIAKYDAIYNKRDGVEFKIDRKKFTGNVLYFTIGWVRVEIENGKPDMRSYNYPENVSWQNSDNWVELILQPLTINF